MINLPDVRQDDDWDCGRACARAVLSSFSIHVGHSDIRLANPVQGMCPSTLEAIIRSYHLSVLSGHLRVHDLKHFTDTGRPVICPISILGGHWVVVCGVSRGSVYYHDPITGPMQRARVASWVSNWRDTDSKGNGYVNWGIVCG